MPVQVAAVILPAGVPAASVLVLIALGDAPSDATECEIPDFMAKTFATLLEAGGDAFGWPRNIGAFGGKVAQPRVDCQNGEHFLRVGLPVRGHAQNSLRP